MQLWLPLLASNTWALLVLLQALRTKDPERLAWLQRRALVCAWLALVGAALVSGFAVWLILNAQHVSGVEPSDPAQKARMMGDVVSAAMRSIFAALLLLLLPLVSRAIVNARAARR